VRGASGVACRLHVGLWGVPELFADARDHLLFLRGDLAEAQDAARG
jgi:hypothetical protein